MMRPDVEFDPIKAKANRLKHGIDFAQAEQALRDPQGMTMPDLDSLGEQRFVTLGMDAIGRVLVVAWTQRGDKARIISARRASKGEVKAYA